jgi:ferredoxin
VDRSICSSSGNCANTAPEVFDQGEDDGVVVLLQTHPGADTHESVRLAAELCPVRAIAIVR